MVDPYADAVSYPPPSEPPEGPAPSALELPPGDAYLTTFQSLLEPKSVLQKHGYKFQRLTDAEIHQKRRCSKCNQTIQQLTKGLKKAPHGHDDHTTSEDMYPRTRPKMLIHYEDGELDVQPASVTCRYHSAVVDRATKRWMCCGEPASKATPCNEYSMHQMRRYRPGELDRLYQFQKTPRYDPDRDMSIRYAVAIDCEMGTARNGDSELIRLSAIDYLTGEVLINNLVKPDQAMLHLNTQWSGVTWDQMNEAVRMKTTLKGKSGARKLLWKFVGQDTVLVGHSVHNDLKALGWIHTRVVDSYVVEHKIIQEKKAIEARENEENEAAAKNVEERLLELTGLAAGHDSPLKTNNQVVGGSTTATEAVPKKKKKKGTGDLALKTMLKKYLATDIQTKGKKGHDSLEDATAARDLVHWMVIRIMQEKDGGMV